MSFDYPADWTAKKERTRDGAPMLPGAAVLGIAPGTNQSDWSLASTNEPEWVLGFVVIPDSLPLDFNAFAKECQSDDAKEAKAGHKEVFGSDIVTLPCGRKCFRRYTSYNKSIPRIKSIEMDAFIPLDEFRGLWVMGKYDLPWREDRRKIFERIVNSIQIDEKALPPMEKE